MQGKIKKNAYAVPELYTLHLLKRKITISTSESAKPVLVRGLFCSAIKAALVIIFVSVDFELFPLNFTFPV